MAPEPKPRFLLSLFRYHGDMLMLTPVIAEIKRMLPHAHIDLLAYQGTETLLRHDPRIDQIFVLPCTSGHAFWERCRILWREFLFLKSLRHLRYDYGLCLTTHYRQAWIARAIRPGHTVGIRDSKRQQSFWRQSFHVLVSDVAGVEHVVMRNYRALKALGLPVEVPTHLQLSYQSPPQAIVKAVRRLQRNMNVPVRYVLLHPFSRKPEKMWRFECWVEVAQHCLDQGYCVVVSGGPADAEIRYANNICSQLRGRVVNIVGGTSLPELGVWVAHAYFYVGVDSVGAHLAAAHDVSGVVLFGPSNANHWHPLSRHMTVVQARPNTTSTCEMCGVSVKSPDEPACLCGLSTQDVMTVLQPLLDAQHKKTSGTVGA